MQDQVKQVAEMVQKAHRIVAFTGAGISTESGIPDFRSSGGLFDQLTGRRFTGEEALSVPFFEQHPELFFENYRNTLDFPEAKPNSGHLFFKRIEDMGKKVTIVTQNIDNLHEAAGNSTVWTVHGNATQWKMVRTNQVVSNNELCWDENGLAVDSKGESLRPNIVLYGDQLDQQVMMESARAVSKADLLFVIGTSLNVVPASYLIDDFRGENAILINQTEVADMSWFNLFIQEKSGQFLEKVWKRLSNEEV